MTDTNLALDALLLENIKIKILNYKKNLIQMKDNYIEKIAEIKFSIYNKYLVIKNTTKTNYYKRKVNIYIKYLL